MIHQWSTDPLRIKGGTKVEEGFMYTSDNNKIWMNVNELQGWIEANRKKIGAI